jgi:hypothetical protein
VLLPSFVMLLAASMTAAQTSGASSAPPDRPLLQIVAVDIDPKPTAPDVLHKLRIRIRNTGPEPASDLTFQVSVSGQRLAPYVNHAFRIDLSPGKETDVPLYNFWSSEAGRAFPKDGRLVVAVQLTGARWMGKQGARDVKPLPSPMTVTLTTRKGS